MPDYSDIRLRDDARTVTQEVLDVYGLGDAAVTALDTGSYNIHFKIEHQGKLFDLRKSNRPQKAENLVYESELLTQLETKGFELAPQIVATNDGQPNYWNEEAGWTLFKWMGDGSPKGRPIVNSERIRQAAGVLSDFHRATRDFVPKSVRGDWPVLTLPAIEPAIWLARVEYLAKNLGEDGDDLLSMAQRSAEELTTVDFNQLPEFMCHGDYRMRNLQFTGDTLTGVFDFDTSIRASRLLDLGGALTRFSPQGGDPQPDVETGSEFLRTYISSSPMSSYELEVLPVFIRWRLLRDVGIYFDYWWLHVRESATALFAGAADEMVNRAISD